VPIAADASAVHGICDRDVSAARSLVDLWPTLLEAVGDRTVVAYNCRRLKPMVGTTGRAWSAARIFVTGGRRARAFERRVIVYPGPGLPDASEAIIVLSAAQQRPQRDYLAAGTTLLDVAKLIVRRNRLVMRLNLIEKLLDLRLASPAAPVSTVESVTAIDDPKDLLETEHSFGFAGNTAPLRSAMTAFSRARFEAGRAAVFVYFGGQCLRVNMNSAGNRWQLLLDSSRSVDDDVAALREALSTTS
jgi:hypothetical protein